MPIARANCTCKTCGATFEMKATKSNSKEAVSWAEWAKDTYDECTECYKKRMKEVWEAEPVTMAFYPEDWQGPNGPKRTIFVRLYGNTKPYKEELKSAGYHWEESADSWVSINRAEYHWEKRYKASYHDDVKETAAEINAWLKAERDFLDKLVGGVKVKDNYTNIERAEVRMFLRELSDEIKRKPEADAAIAGLYKPDAPEKPDCLPEGRWNGKVYGKAGRWTIYIDGEVESVSDDEAKELKAYAEKLAEYKADLEDYRKSVKEIKEKYQVD